MFAIKFFYKFVFAIKSALARLLLLICEDFVLTVVRPEIYDDYDRIVDEQVKKKLSEKWYQDMKKLENFRQTAAVRMDVFHYTTAQNISEYLRFMGFEIRSAKDVNQWLFSLRFLPREDIYNFLSDTIRLYSFMRIQIFGDDAATETRESPSEE